MRYVIISTVAGADSPGRLAANICRKLEEDGHEVVLAYSRVAKNCNDITKIKIGNIVDYGIHLIGTRLNDDHGLFSTISTKKFLKWLDEYIPDVVWLHNIHGYYLNYIELFKWIKHTHVKVIWTLHDCWAFTGHCAYFTFAQCEKWKTGCGDCPIKSNYPKSLVDNSRRNYRLKKKSFSNVDNMTIITPSQWLADLAMQSFLKKYDIVVEKNKIDTSVFYKRENAKNRYNKKIVLAVANGWGPRKGEKDIYELSKLLDDSYVILMVGLSKKQIKKLPKGIVGIERTSDQDELAKLYSIAEWFINPTYEDNYPTVNLEAQACGCRVITYDVGGCPETIYTSNSFVIPIGVDNIVKVIKSEEGRGE